MKNQLRYLTFSQAKPHLKNSDILLFRGKGLISKCIQVFSSGKYSHVGLVSTRETTEVCEVREWKGGRCVLLEREVKKYSGQIDVYRVAGYTRKYHYDNGRVNETETPLDRESIIRCMRVLCGSSYNYNSIWKILKRNLPVLRWLYSTTTLNTDNPVKESVSYICSSAVAHCFSQAGYDLVLNKGDELVTPNDIGRSSSLSYLFTLTTV